MSKNIKDLYDKLNVITISKDDYNKIVKDRVDFGFDSIYFRYAEVCDELAAFRAQYYRTDPIKEQNAMSGRKRHFYDALEQLLMAHTENKGDKE